jgi:glycosyltransferase involved in cell wall biosynthesis
MKIAQIAPLIESVPPRLYGGTERIVSYLTEELVRLGHDVTLFASGDSITSAELASCCTRGLRLDLTVRDIIPHFMLMIDKVRERAEEFDVLHFHIDLFHFPLFRSLAARTLTTLRRPPRSGPFDAICAGPRTRPKLNNPAAKRDRAGLAPPPSTACVRAHGARGSLRSGQPCHARCVRNNPVG